MRYYIVQKGETLDYILDKFHLSKESFEAFNGSIKKELWGPGLKVIVSRDGVEPPLVKNDSLPISPMAKTVNQLYQKNGSINAHERQFICPHCKKIILIPNPKETHI